MTQTEVCARCGKPIRKRTRFAIYYQERKLYSSQWINTPLALYFHEKCVGKISAKIHNLWDLTRIMAKLEIRK